MDYNLSRARQGPSVLDTLPEAYVKALRRTPRGIVALGRLKKFDQKKFSGQFAGVEVRSDALPGGAHAHTRITDSGIRTEISTWNEQPGDRMLGWEPEEILNVVGVHEVAHIVFDDTGVADTDGCVGVYCPCHPPTVAEELVSRLQYSLIHRKASSPKAGWMDGYLAYFALARHLAADATHKRLCREAAGADDERAFALLEKELTELEANARSTTEPSKASQEYARTAVLKLYGEAVSGMKKGAALFAKEGVHDSLDDYKDVLARADEYEKDATFTLIP